MCEKALRWGNLPLEEIKTVEVERWLRSTEVATLIFWRCLPTPFKQRRNFV
jgi:hypothetical protein